MSDPRDTLRHLCHDLSNDLSAIAGYADFLDLDLEMNHPCRVTLEKLIIGIARARSTVSTAHLAVKTPALDNPGE